MVSDRFKSAVVVPYDQLSPEALQGVVEEFVTRDGTDYGEIEVPLEEKVSRVLSQLASGKAVIVYDNQSGTCTILPGDHPALKMPNVIRPASPASPAKR